MMEEEHGYTQTFDVQSFGENIETWLETVCTTNEIGWDVYIKDGNYVFALMDGVDRSYQQDKLSYVVFSPEFDNLLTTNYQYTKESYSNCALIGGEGEGISQRTAHIGDYSGLQRFESYIDGSSVSSNGEIITVEQYEQMLRDYGK